MTATLTPQTKQEEKAEAFSPAVSRGWLRVIPRIFGTVLWIIAIICVLAAIGRAFRDGMQPVRQTIDAVILPAPANLAYGVFLAMLATATLRRKRIAWWFLTVYFILGLIAGAAVALILALVPSAEIVDDAGNPLFEGTDIVLLWVGVGVSIVALGLLFAGRKEFYARVRKGQRAARDRGVRGAGADRHRPRLLAGDRVPRHPRGRAGPARVRGGARLRRRGQLRPHPGRSRTRLGQPGPRLLRRGRALRRLAVLLRAQRRSSVLHADDEQRIRTLLAKFGDRDSLGYFATRRDKAAMFSPTGKSAITYRVVNGVSLASGDPVGDPEAWGPAIDAWLAEARTYAWTPAVMGASEQGAIAYARTGLKVIHLGDEAILLTKEFTLDGRDMRPVRQAVNRVERAGYEARVRRHADPRLVPNGPSALVLVDPTADPPPARPPGGVPRWPVRAAARVGATLGPVVWGLAVRQLSSRPPAAVLRANARRVYGRGSVAAATALEWLAYSRMTHDLAQLRAVTEPPAVPVVVLTALTPPSP